MPTQTQVKVKRISRQKAIALLQGQKGATFVTIRSLTQPTMRKTLPDGTANPFYKRVWKRARVNGVICWHYANAVNNQRVREGKTADFEPEPRCWGTRLRRKDGSLTPWVANVNAKGEFALYLELKVERSLSHEYVDEDGNVLDTATVEACLPPRDESSRQEVEKEIILRDYRMDNIEALYMGGKAYEIDPV